MNVALSAMKKAIVELQRFTYKAVSSLKTGIIPQPVLAKDGRWETIDYGLPAVLIFKYDNKQKSQPKIN